VLLHSPFPRTATWLWLAFFASFAVKVPMWPVHTWLPDAHVEAPTAGSVILAGVLLKMGAYGFLRFSVPMLPGEHYFRPSCSRCRRRGDLHLAGGAGAEDMKKLIAYSSVAHMGFVTIGIFTFNQQGIDGALFQMLSHGIVSGALFLCVGVVYDRMHTREIARYGGLARTHAGLCAGVHAVHHGLGRAARHLRLRRRVPGAGRRLPGQFLAGVAGHHRHDPGRRPTCCTSIAAVIFGKHHQGRSRAILDLAARNERVRAAGRADAVDGHLSLVLQGLYRPSVAQIVEHQQEATGRAPRTAATPPNPE
jgi:hypothetical protein